MVWLGLIFALLFPTLLGFSFINLFLSNQEDTGLIERLALGFCAGFMLITLEMAYLLPRFHIPYSILSIATPLTLILIWGLIVAVKNRLFELRINVNLNLIERILIGLIAFQVLFVFCTVMIKPVVGVDAWLNYSVRAKAFYLEGANNLSTLPPTGRGDHVALTQTWTFYCINQWNDVLGKVSIPFYFLSFLIIFYCAVRRFHNRTIALASTLLLGTLPFLAYHATLEYTDFPIAIYLFAGVSFLLLCLKKPKLNYLLLAGFFLLSTITIKNEAYYHLAMIAAIFVYMVFFGKLGAIKRIKQLRWTTFLLVLVGGLYVLLKALSRPEINLLAPGQYLARLWPLLTVFFDYYFFRSNFSLLWLLLVLALIFNHRQLKDHLPLFALVVIEVVGFMFFYLTAKEDIYNWLFYVSPAVRNSLQFVPLVALLTAYLMPAKFLSDK